jgi:deoxyadenosine/deoxycytidine kinase
MSFKTQICFLGLKAEQMKSLNKKEKKALINSTDLALPQVEIFVPPIEMDALYGQVQAEMGLMGSREYKTYTMTYEIFKRDVVAPIDLYVLVDASAEVLLERILDERKRKFEHPGFFKKYPDYLERLTNAVRKWHKDEVSEHSVVLVDSVNNNFADNAKEGEKILIQIEDGIKNFFVNNPHANEDTEIPYGRDGAQLIVPDFLKTR